MILFFWYSIHKKPPTLDLSKVDGLYQSVDATGFEPATSASRTQRSTKLRHASIFMKHFVVSQIVLHYIITSFSVCPEKFCIFLIFLKFQTKPPKIYDIMNSDEFILEVPAELRMRKRQRRKDDIIKRIKSDQSRCPCVEAVSFIQGHLCICTKQNMPKTAICKICTRRKNEKP